MISRRFSLFCILMILSVFYELFLLLLVFLLNARRFYDDEGGDLARACRVFISIWMTFELYGSFYRILIANQYCLVDWYVELCVGWKVTTHCELHRSELRHRASTNCALSSSPLLTNQSKLQRLKPTTTQGTDTKSEEMTTQAEVEGKKLH